MSGYQVWIKVPGLGWIKASRTFDAEGRAQDWALDILDGWPREIRRTGGDDE